MVGALWSESGATRRVPYVTLGHMEIAMNPFYGHALACALAAGFGAFAPLLAAQQYPSRAPRIVAGRPEEYRAFIKAQMDLWTPLVKASGMRIE